MKLLNHFNLNDVDVPAVSSIEMCDINIKRELDFKFEELRSVEEKFYKLFDLNPCPMSISDIRSDEILDVNESFLRILDFNDKKEVIGKNSKELNIVRSRDRYNVIKILEKEGVVKEYACKIRTKKGKRLTGMFTGTPITFNNVPCILLICHIVNKKCISQLFKTLFMF